MQRVPLHIQQGGGIAQDRGFGDESLEECPSDDGGNILRGESITLTVSGR